MRFTDDRPSFKELNKKIRLAREVFDRDGYRPADPAKLASNFSWLRLLDLESQTAALKAALDEIGVKNYCGSRPPDKSYEASTRDAELFEFRWESAHFRRKMYFKFTIINPCSSEPVLYVYSIHVNRPREKGR